MNVNRHAALLARAASRSSLVPQDYRQTRRLFSEVAVNAQAAHADPLAAMLGYLVNGTILQQNKSET